MTPEELEKYKKQLENLKKDFHKENIENIEKVLDSEKTQKIVVDEKLPNQSILEKIRQLGSDESTQADQPIKKENILSEESKPFDFTQNNKTEKKIVTSIISEKPIDAFEKENKNTNIIAEKTSPKKHSPENVQTDKKDQNIIPPITPNNTNNELDESGNLNVLKYILLLLVLILIGFIAYFFYTKNLKNQTTSKVSTEEKSYIDSVLNYEQELIRQEIEAKYNEDGVVLENSELISDSIYQISSTNPAAYYVVIGSFGSLENAQKLKNKHKTAYESYIFNTDKIRVALKISEDENQVFNDLSSIKTKFPDAWLMYNRN